MCVLHTIEMVIRLEHKPHPNQRVWSHIEEGRLETTFAQSICHPPKLMLEHVQQQVHCRFSHQENISGMLSTCTMSMSHWL